MSAAEAQQKVGPPDPLDPLPLMLGPQSAASLDESLLHPPLRKKSLIYWGLLGFCATWTMVLFAGIVVVYTRGIGAMGNDIPVAWGFPITNFVWWIGFGHAGTLISAILVLFQQKWRSSINRFAEAMTLCAVTQAGIFPVLHLGRPLRSFWLAPYPSTLQVWPQFRSSLTWDMAAVATYFLVSLLFWYVGLIPDLACARDRSTGLRAKIYGVFALGWKGSGHEWHTWRASYLLLAGLATALVVSVESIVSFDFCIAQLPGWHDTIFPPYFVVSAMYSGFCLLLVLIVPTRKLLKLEHVITTKHIDLMGKLLLALALMATYGYIQENFFAWYKADPFEAFAFAYKRAGDYSAVWITQIVTTSLVPMAMWITPIRRNAIAAWWVGLAGCVGAWCEQFGHVVPPLAHDYLPSSWGLFAPTWVDWALLLGSIGFFGFLFLLFLGWVPPVPIGESKEIHEQLTIDEPALAERKGWTAA